jgi:hypothetical protein
MPHRIPRHYWRRFRAGARRVLHADATPHAIALGVATGVFISFTPTVGLQMVLGAAIATALRANRLAAILPAWISNPLTIPPIFLFNYSVGRIFIHAPDLERFREHLDRTMDVFRTEGLAAAIRGSLTVSGDILEALWVGSLLVGTTAAVPSYFLVRRAVLRIRRRRAERNRQPAAPGSDGTAAPPPSEADPPRAGAEDSGAPGS